MKPNNFVCLKKIIFSSLLAHVIFVLILYLPKKSQKKPTRIVVREKIYPKASPQRKSPVKKKLPAKPIGQIRKPKRGQKTNPVKKRAIIDELEKSLQILSEDKPTFKNKISIPKKVHLTIDRKHQSVDFIDTYELDLVELLQNSLQFEDVGDVKLKITIQADGKLLNFTTLESKNKQNEIYLKNRLPQLNFPCFNTYDISKNELTFVVRFCNNL